MAKTKVLICPYCGETQPAGERCRGCGGLFDPLSRQATHNAMGPWFIRDEKRLFHPGCSYETLVKLIDRGIVDRYTLLRGPTTKQYWTVAKHAAGISHLLGYCHNCDASVDPGDHGCHACGVPFGAYLDRNYMGLPDIKPLPWESDEAEDASGAVRGVVTWADDTPTPQPGTVQGPSGFGGGSEAAGSGTRGPGGGARISSFATNEELLQSGASRAGNGARGESGAGTIESARGTSTAGRAAGPDTLSTAEAKTAPAAMTAPAPPAGPKVAPAVPAASLAVAVAETSEPFATHPVARSMRRRIDKQRRTIRQLTIMAVVLGVLCVLLATPMLMEMMSSNDGSNGERSENASQSLPGGNRDTASPSGEPANGGATANDAADASGTATSNDGGGNEDSSTAPPTVGDDLQEPPIDDVQGNGDSNPINNSGSVDQLRHATDLLHAARDQSRSAEARLTDAKAAIETLRTVAADARTSPDLEAQLTEQIARTEELIKELETIIFFDDD